MSKINKVLLAKVEDKCAFCGESEFLVSMLFIGCTGKGICNNCVDYVREEMGLKVAPKTEVEKIIDNV